MTKPLPFTARTLPAREACTHAGCRTMATFHAWVRKGILPGPIPGTHNYSRDAIDEALDRRAGAPTVREETAYGAWKRREGAAQGRQHRP
jgi:hypothetical protein